MNATDYYNQRLKPPKAFYEWCWANMRTYVWMNKKQTIVASNRSHDEVIHRRLTKNSRLSFYDKHEYVEIILSTSKRIERQVYSVASKFVDGKQVVNIELVNLHLFTNNQYIKVSFNHCANSYQFGLAPVSSGAMWESYDPYIYPNQWKERLQRVSELKYLDLDRLTYYRLERFYKYRDRLEYIQKIQAIRIEEQFYYNLLDMRVVTMNWLKKWRLFIRKSERCFSDVQLKNELDKRNVKFVEGIENYLNHHEIEKCPTQMNLLRFQNYLIRQKSTFRYYQDYIGLLKDIGLEITNKRQFPKDLKNAHDEAVEVLTSMQREMERTEFEERAKALSNWEMTISDYVFLLPKSPNDLVEEAKALKHCVSRHSYILEHSKGISTIVFVRKKNNPKQPYYTMEFINNSVEQLYGFKNNWIDEKRIPKPESLLNAVEEWQERIVKTKKMKKSA